MTDRRFRIDDELRQRLRVLGKEMEGKVTAGLDDSLPGEGCGHYCRAQCEGSCGNIADKAQ